MNLQQSIYSAALRYRRSQLLEQGFRRQYLPRCASVFIDFFHSHRGRLGRRLWFARWLPLS